MPTNSAPVGRALVLVLTLPFLLTASSCDSRPSHSQAAAVAAKAAGPQLDPNVVQSDAPVRDIDDPRLAYLREASARWRRSQGPKRLVVDQVCLVPDVPTFLAAIAGWDERHFYPILIDDPQWTLPFLRAFRPARIVRCASASASKRRGTPPTTAGKPPSRPSAGDGCTRPRKPSNSLPRPRSRGRRDRRPRAPC